MTHCTEAVHTLLKNIRHYDHNQRDFMQHNTHQAINPMIRVPRCWGFELCMADCDQARRIFKQLQQEHAEAMRLHLQQCGAQDYQA